MAAAAAIPVAIDTFNTFANSGRGGNAAADIKTSQEIANARATGNLFPQLGGSASASLDTGLSNLLEILNSQGRINPLSRNRALTNVGRNTESQITANRQSAAGAGLQRSGVVGAGGAVEAALRASGADRAAAVEADFVQQEETRKRNDLLLLLQLVLNPQIQREGISAGVATNQAAISQQRQGAAIGAGTSVLSSLLDFFSNRNSDGSQSGDREDSFG